MGLFFLGISIWLFPVVPLPLSCEVIQLRCFQFNGNTGSGVDLLHGIGHASFVFVVVGDVWSTTIGVRYRRRRDDPGGSTVQLGLKASWAGSSASSPTTPETNTSSTLTALLPRLTVTSWPPRSNPFPFSELPRMSISSVKLTLSSEKGRLRSRSLSTVHRFCSSCQPIGTGSLASLLMTTHFSNKTIFLTLCHSCPKI
ncbi:hypothetical protein ABKV19_000409 [Rosa sericea]